NQLTCVNALGSDTLPARIGARGPAPQWPTRRLRGGARPEDVRMVPVHDNATLADASWRDTLQRDGVNAHIDVQLRSDDLIWGRLRLESAQPRRWHADEVALAGYFSDVLAVAIDRERGRAAEARLEYLSLYDPVSGVANRTMFLACIGQLLARMQRRPRLAALLFVNIDGFFNVNETLGEAGGDSSLATLAERINAATPDDAVVARVESDCFGVLLPRIAGEVEAAAQAQRLLDAIAQPLSPTLEVSASIGMAFVGPIASAGAANAETLLRDADLASRVAKSGGHNRIEVFDPEGHLTLVERLRIERLLRKALREDRIEIAYQAEYTPGSSRRWNRRWQRRGCRRLACAWKSPKPR
ncbi:MAG: GGDEF domain-containing protein, partial [Gammaproteobacteria bacterium]|nr:GGDEF domain-containing protein [Gammaproteobacteria bacterium]